MPDFRPYSKIGNAFSNSLTYLEFQDKLQLWAKDVAFAINNAPEWNDDWKQEHWITNAWADLNKYKNKSDNKKKITNIMSKVITFYSYKGGVGRTMALANVSVILAKWGHKVLVVDWDLEAPGLEHFYKKYIGEDNNIINEKSGVVDLLQTTEKLDWKACVINIKISYFADAQVDLISSGKRDEEYFKKVRNFNVDTFYENGGGEVVENL